MPNITVFNFPKQKAITYPRFLIPPALRLCGLLFCAFSPLCAPLNCGLPGGNWRELLEGETKRAFSRELQALQLTKKVFLKPWRAEFCHETTSNLFAFFPFSAYRWLRASLFVSPCSRHFERRSNRKQRCLSYPAPSPGCGRGSGSWRWGRALSLLDLAGIKSWQRYSA